MPRVAEVAQRQHEQGVEVVTIRGVEADLAEQWRPSESRIAFREPSEEAVAEQPLFGRQAERERGDGEVQTAEPERGHADGERNHSPGNSADQQAECQVDVPSRCACRTDRSTDADDRHLPERDLPGPTDEHHQRQSDDREREDCRRLDDVPDAEHERHPEHDHGSDGDECGTGKSHPAVAAFGGLERPYLLCTAPRAAGLDVASRPAGRLHQQAPRT